MKTFAVLAVLTFVMASADAIGFFSKRRDQRNPKPYERPLSSHFRQRLGTAVRRPRFNESANAL